MVSYLDQDSILTVMDTITDQTANAAGINLNTCPLHKDTTDIVKISISKKMAKYTQT